MLLGELGYRLTLVVLAGMVALVAVLALGVAGRPEGQSEGPKQSLRAALREAAGHRGYWLLNAGFFVCGFQLVFIAKIGRASVRERVVQYVLYQVGAVSLKKNNNVTHNGFK